mmetsp:Transcript_2702/g.5644  ORF Transcript_2702/g.5644 Transcript_2702/m.5644 type:complete len:368 (+) Transcript_2702:222-1325(+)
MGCNASSSYGSTVEQPEAAAPETPAKAQSTLKAVQTEVTSPAESPRKVVDDAATSTRSTPSMSPRGESDKPTVHLEVTPEPSIGRLSSAQPTDVEDSLSPRESSVEVIAQLKDKAYDAPEAVKLHVDRVMKRGESKSSLLLAKVARSRYQNSMLRVSGELASSHGKLMTPAKSRRELERVASLKGSSKLVRLPSSTSNEVSPTSIPEAVETVDGPSADGLARFVGTWRGGAVEGREEFLKAMELPWLVRKIAAMLPNFDMVFFIDEEGVLRSHASTLGKVVEESYREGGQSTKTFKGITTTVTYHWEGDVLTYTVAKESAPEEEAKSRRWIEADGVTMKAESLFRKDASKPWATLHRTWTRADAANV